MKHIFVVYLLAEHGTQKNLAFKHVEGLPLPTIGESVFFSDASVKFKIVAREYLYVSDEELRIFYRIERSAKLSEPQMANYHAALSPLSKM